MTKGLNSEDNSVAVYTFKRIGSNKSLSTFQDWNQHRQCRKLSEEKKQGFIDLVTKKNITMKSVSF